MSQAQSSFAALEGLLAKDISEIADLPDYKSPPTGKYKLLCERISERQLGDSPAVQILWSVEQVIELADPETEAEDQAVPGNKFTEAFFFGKEEFFENSLGGLKKKFAPFAEVVGSTNLLDILKGVEGLIMDADVIQRVNKKTIPHSLNSSTKNLKLSAS